MQNTKFQFIFFLIGCFLLLSNCKEVKEEWLTPEWITDKITILSSDCYYEGSSITKYAIDTVVYIDVYVPSNLWPEENVYFKDGKQVISVDASFSYYNFTKNRGTALEEIWSYPTENNCP